MSELDSATKAVETGAKIVGKIMDSVNKAVEKAKEGMEAGSLMQNNAQAQNSQSKSQDNGIGM